MNTPPPLQVLVVEDHELLREELVDYLGLRGCAAHGVGSGSALDDWIAAGHLPDIVVLDLNLPGEDGLQIAQRLRDICPGVGIAMLTARTGGPDRIAGYRSGADLYLPKPVGGEELFAALQSLERRLERPRPEAWVLDPRALSVCAPGGASAAVSAGEAAVLLRLALVPGGLARSHELLVALGGGRLAHDKAYLEVLMTRLRKKLLALQADPQARLIQAVRGQGYRLLFTLAVAPGGPPAGKISAPAPG